MVYEASSGAHFSDNDAQILGQRFESLAQQGPLTAETVVDDARPADAPLHPFFEWDDASAAEEYRREQARYLLRHIVVRVTESSEPIRAFKVVTVSNDEDDPGERGYVHINQVAADAGLLQQIIRDEMRVLSGSRKRLLQYKKLRPVVTLIDQAIEQLAEHEHSTKAA